MLGNFVQVLFPLLICLVDLVLFTSKYILSISEHIELPAVPYNKFIGFGIVWVTC